MLRLLSSSSSRRLPSVVLFCSTKAWISDEEFFRPVRPRPAEMTEALLLLNWWFVDGLSRYREMLLTAATMLAMKDTPLKKKAHP